MTRQVSAARARLQPVPARARDRPGRAAARPARRAGRPGVLRQLGHRGQRGGGQAGPPAIRAAARPVIVAAEGGFHGRTMGALALTGKASIRRAVRPVRRSRSGSCPTAMRPRCRSRRPRLPPPCSSSRARARRGGPAARRVPAAPRGRRATRPARCWCSTRSRAASAAPAHWFAHQADGRRRRTCSPWPRGWAAGCRSGPASGWARSAGHCASGDHGSTFGGNPVACAAALAVLDTIESDGPARPGGGRRRPARGAASRGRSHPLLSRGARGRACWLGRAAGRAGRCRGQRPPAARPGSWSTPSSRTRSGSPRR